MVEGSERAKKQRVLYDPSHGRVGLKSKVGKSELEDDNLIQLNEDSTTTTEKAGERLVIERVSPNKATEKLKCVETTMGRGKTNVTSSVAQEQEKCKESEAGRKRLIKAYGGRAEAHVEAIVAA